MVLHFLSVLRTNKIWVMVLNYFHFFSVLSSWRCSACFWKTLATFLCSSQWVCLLFCFCFCLGVCVWRGGGDLQNYGEMWTSNLFPLIPLWQSQASTAVRSLQAEKCYNVEERTEHSAARCDVIIMMTAMRDALMFPPFSFPWRRHAMHSSAVQNTVQSGLVLSFFCFMKP